MNLKFITDGSMLNIPVIQNVEIIPRIGECIRVGIPIDTFTRSLKQRFKLACVSMVIYDYTSNLVEVYLEDKE